MSDCFSKNDSTLSNPEKRSCPGCGQAYSQVSIRTIFHHIKEPWKLDNQSEVYCFCGSETCEVVYYGERGRIIKKTEIREKVGIKERSEEAILCYCFGVTRAMAAQELQAVKFIHEKTKDHLCACDVRNPSGKCCLKDFKIENIKT